MQTILDSIVEHKRGEIAARRAQTPLAELEHRLGTAVAPRGFARSLAQAAADHPAVIAEIKRGSPSLGCIRPELDAPAQAEAYERGGAAALSVLTDQKFFFGSDADFISARERVGLPMLRKEFIIDEYQLHESRVLGADCILLIMAILTDEQAAKLAETARELGLDVLAEGHNANELRRALDLVDSDLIGINSRNLRSFETSEEVTLKLAKLTPDRDRLVAESGLHNPAAIRRLWEHGIRRFLVGEAFVKSEDPEATVRSFVSSCQTDRITP